jgi:hypothetical protein
MIEIDRLCLVMRHIIPSRVTGSFALYARSYILIIVTDWRLLRGI